MLRVLIGVLLAFGSCSVAQSAESDGSLSAKLSAKVKIIFAYYPSPSHEQGYGSILFGESMFLEKEVDCRVVSFSPNTIPQIPGLENVIDLTDFSKSATGAPAKTNVSGAWMQFGIILGNPNTGTDNNYTLVIDQVILRAQGKYDQQELSYVKIIRARDYCGAPFLYVVSPGNILEYQPFSDNPLENLTFYLDGIPVVESIEEDELVKIIPDYEMEFTLMGWFVSEDGSSVDFVRKVGITTSSLRFIKTDESGWVRVPSAPNL